MAVPAVNWVQVDADVKIFPHITAVIHCLHVAELKQSSVATHVLQCETVPFEVFVVTASLTKIATVGDGLQPSTAVGVLPNTIDEVQKTVVLAGQEVNTGGVKSLVT